MVTADRLMIVVSMFTERPKTLEPTRVGAFCSAVAVHVFWSRVAQLGRSGHGNALLAISAASAISAREKRNAQRRRERRGPAVGIESAMDGESAPTTHTPNKAAPVNAPVAFWFHAGRAWRRVTAQQRSAKRLFV